MHVERLRTCMQHSHFVLSRQPFAHKRALKHKIIRPLLLILLPTQAPYIWRMSKPSKVIFCQLSTFSFFFFILMLEHQQHTLQSAKCEGCLQLNTRTFWGLVAYALKPTITQEEVRRAENDAHRDRGTNKQCEPFANLESNYYCSSMYFFLGVS